MEQQTWSERRDLILTAVIVFGQCIAVFDRFVILWGHVRETDTPPQICTHYYEEDRRSILHNSQNMTAESFI